MDVCALSCAMWILTFKGRVPAERYARTRLYITEKYVFFCLFVFLRNYLNVVGFF